MNENNKKKISLADNAAPVLLSAAVISSASYVYACGSGTVALLFALVSSLYAVGLFTLYEVLRLKKKTWLTVLSVAVTIVAVNALATAIIRDPSQVGVWFMEPSRFTRVYYDYSFAFILVLGFILISCLYYFTRVRYRGVFVFLICLCPFCLFAKTFTDIPVLFPVIIMTLFFFIMLSNTAGEGAKPSRKYAAAFPFILVITAIAAFSPKIEFAPFREQFDEFVTGVSIGTEGAANLMDFSDSSSNTTSRDEDTVVYYFYGDNPGRVKRQCFNSYDIATNTWGYYGNSQEGNSGFPRYIMFEDATELYDVVGYTGSSEKEPAEKKCIARPATGTVHALFTREDMTDIALYGKDAKVYRTELDEYFVSRYEAEGATAYTMKWNDTKVDTAFERLMTDEYALSLVENGSESTALYSYLLTKRQAIQYDEYLLSEDVMDRCFSSKEARQRVRELAAEITAGCGTGYEKAKAIEAYFRSGEYIYDKNYTAPDPSPDYFIFSSRRGACASYATAAALMCRELGLTARYCEGLLVQSRDDEKNAWYSTTGDSHAFVQVWINGYGWTDFDPTSFIEDGGYIDPTFVYVGIIAAAAAFIVFLITLLRPRIKEALFVGKVKRARGAAQASLIYCRINTMLNTLIGSKHNTFTPTETAEKCRELLEYDIDGFVAYYENALYGGIGDPDADNSQIYTQFRKSFAEARKKYGKTKKRGGKHVHR